MKIPYQDTVINFFTRRSSNESDQDASGIMENNQMQHPMPPQAPPTHTKGITAATNAPNMPPMPSNYNEQFQQYLDRLEAYDAAEKFNQAKPFLYLSLLMWPGVWLYRGIEWHNQRKTQNLQVYINKTFAQAKLIQICIITSALVAASIKKKPNKMLNVNKENK